MYETNISGPNSTNNIGGTHEYHYHSNVLKPIERPLFLDDRLPSTTFVGRVDEMADLHRLLQMAGSDSSSNSSNLVAIAAASGMGGIGKTELALQYVAQYEKDYPGGVWWLSARGLLDRVLSYTHRMELPEPRRESDDVSKVQECYRFWEQGVAGVRLLVVDDVTTLEDYAQVLPYLPKMGAFRVLVTTRERLQQVQRLDLDVLKPEEAMTLLGQLVGVDRVGQEEVAAADLCKWLGYLPIGIELVGRYLAAKVGTTVAKLLERLKAQKLDARALLRNGQPMTAEHESLAKVFEVSWADLPAATQWLGAFLSLFGLAAIPWDVVTQCLPEWDEEDLEDSRDKLLSRHLLLPGMQMHTMIREFSGVKLAELENGRVDDHAERTTFIGVLLEQAQTTCAQTMNQSQLKAVVGLVPHWIDITERQLEEQFGQPIGIIAANLGLYYYAQGLYQDGTAWTKRALAISEAQLGPDHPDTGTSLNNLAGLYESIGRYSESEPLYKRALAISEAQLGPDHPSTGTSLNNLAGLYESIGRYSDAEPLYLNALQVFTQSLPEGHPHIEGVFNNFVHLLVTAIQAGQANQLSDHPITQSIVAQIQENDQTL